VACPQWHCRAWLSPVLTARIWPRGRGSGWKRGLTRARRKGGSTRCPAWSRSRSARSPLRGTTGSPRSGSESGGPGRRTWPGCALRGIRLPAGTGHRMRRRSGWCWTASTRGPWPGPYPGQARAVAGVPAGRPRPACAVIVTALRPGPCAGRVLGLDRGAGRRVAGARGGDVDPGQQLITVVRKGSRAVQQLPASADAFVWLRLYQVSLGASAPSGADDPLWWTNRKPLRPLTYHAARAMFMSAITLATSSGEVARMV
jgi:hypothetical protein